MRTGDVGETLNLNAILRKHFEGQTVPGPYKLAKRCGRFQKYGTPIYIYIYHIPHDLAIVIILVNLFPPFLETPMSEETERES